MTWNAGTLTLWIDGERVDIDTGKIPPLALGSTIYIGRGGTTHSWDNLIGSVDIFGEALADAEMALYTAGSGTVIPVTSRHTYQMKFEDNLVYGTCGTYATRWLDAGANATDSTWTRIKSTTTTPTGTAVTYRFRASNTKSESAVWYDSITDSNVRGRYIQVKACLLTDDHNVTPTVSYLEPIARFS
jgi:hypothetical protein